MTQLTNIRGVIRGRTIELDEPLSVPDGVTVTVTVAYGDKQDAKVLSRSSLEEAAGSWADDAEEIDKFLAWNREQRKLSRPEIEP